MKAELILQDDDFVRRVADAVAERLRPMLARAPAEPDELMTTETLCEYLHVSERFVYERTQRKDIPFIKTGSLLRFRKSEIDAWLRSVRSPAQRDLSAQGLKLLKTRNRTFD